MSHLITGAVTATIHSFRSVVWLRPKLIQTVTVGLQSERN